MKNLPRKRRNCKRSHKINTNWETPIFEHLEPRLLLNADIYGLTAGQESIVPLDAETSIEVDLNNQANSPVGETTGAPIAQSLPYTQDFISGKPDSAAGWEYYSDTAEGRIQVVGGRLRMDDTTGNGTYTLNEAILHVDLTNKTNVTLTLDHWSLNDENTSIQDSFTNHFKGDGIALSVDGVNWIKVTDLTTSFTAKSFDLDAIIALAKDAAGSDDVSNVRIKIQQYDNYPVISGGGDGREFDNISVTASMAQTVPYTQDFESGLPVSGWEYYSDTAEGRIQVVSGHLRMDDTTGNGTYTLNEAILHVDLTGKRNVTLTLDHWSLNDENTSILDSFTDHYKGDGIALSVDGINWIKVTDLTTDFTAKSFELDAIIDLAKDAAGSDDVSNVRIKFQQYDNYPVISGGGDGREFDNISVTAEMAQPVPYTQDFESGLPELNDGWEYYSDTAEGRIQVVGGRLRMDDTTGNGTYTLNEAILHVNLTGKTEVTLTLDHWTLNDENTVIQDTFTDHYKGDGIALSVDGINWVKVTNLDINFTAKSFALDAIIELAKTAAGSDDLSDVRIKFQQYDNYPVDSDGREFDNISVTASMAQAVPYTQNFESTLPGLNDGWEYYSDTAEGRIQVVDGHLRMDDTTGNGTYTLNEAILHVNLTGKTKVTLTLDHLSLNDENTSIKDSFTDHYKGDGIALSVDGINWIKVTNLTTSFTAKSFDLDSIIELAKTAAGSDDVSDVRIKFQQYDNYPVVSGGGDGREFDNISVTASIAQAVPYTQNFESGLPGSAQGWEYYSNTAEGRIQVVDGHLRMDDTTGNGTYTLNEAILHVNLTDKTNVTLTLDHTWINDEYNGIEASFTEHNKGDGIALSVDGINWIRITNLDGSFTAKSFELDAIIDLAKDAAGSDDVSDVRIKFQQYDNYPANSDGREFDNISVTADMAQPVPYTQDFESGLPVSGWEYYSDTAEGRIQVVSGHLRMDDTTGNGTYTLNEAILHVDLTGKTDVTLTLDHWSLNDENTSILDSFTDHYKGDGIALSVDGINWIKVTDLTTSFTAKSFDLDSIIELAKDAAESDDVSDVRIKFQQYDNYPVISGGGDGREFDNIQITAT